MTRRLQSSAFEESQYSRPNDNWVCGRAGAAGGQCNRCVPRAEERKGHTVYFCTRPPELGGKCVLEPFHSPLCQQIGATLPGRACLLPGPACRPRLRLPGMRRLVSVSTAVAAFILLLLIVRSPAWIEPGPLASGHGHLEGKCNACHLAGRSPLSWASALVDSSESGQSRLCMRCHAMGPFALLPHSSEPSALAVVTGRIPASRRGGGGVVLGLATRLLPPPTGKAGTLPCATCHRDHHGSEQPLSAMDPEPCQSCHASKFTGFASDHPQFSPLGVWERDIPKFNHLKHQSDFEKEGKAFVCLACHEADEASEHVRLKGFDDSCGSCHLAKNILSAQNPSLVIATLPEIEGLEPGGPMTLSDAPNTGFMLDDGDYEIEYRPSRHADAILRDLLDRAGLAYATEAGRSLFDQLASAGATGQCTKCHAVEASSDGSRRVRWKPVLPHLMDVERTRFSHAPHLGHPCEDCHQFVEAGAEKAPPSGSPATVDAKPGEEFRPLSRQACVICHAPGKAEDTCLTCHGYHFAGHRLNVHVAEPD